MGYFRTDDPAADADRYYEDKRKPIGRCEYCNESVFSPEEAEDDERPYEIEPNLFLHECCIMGYAKDNWRYRG